MNIEDILQRYLQFAARFGVRDVSTVHYIVMFIAAAHVLAVVTWAIFTARSEANNRTESTPYRPSYPAPSVPSTGSTRNSQPRRRPRPKSGNEEIEKGGNLRARLAALRAQRARAAAAENSKDN